MSQNQPPQLTMHAMLVVWGQFAQYLGLPQAMVQVLLGQKTVTHSPQTKVIEFLVAIMGGLAHLKDISRSAHPLDQDAAVAQAWGQPAWADYSGVSRTLSSLSMTEAEQIVAVLTDISQAYIDQEIALSQRQTDKVIYDGDLTGRPVSKSSTTYPDVAYGHMDDGLHLGYQAAMVSMNSPTYGRQWLWVQPHPGNTISSKQLTVMVAAVEQQTHRRPLRRTDLLCQRVSTAQTKYAKALAWTAKAEQTLLKAETDLHAVKDEWQHWQRQVIGLEATYASQGYTERPHSQLAQARHKVEVYERRYHRRVKAVATAQRRYQKHQVLETKAYAELVWLQNHLTRCAIDNETNPAPIQAEFRLDAGFGTTENIAYLIEMGYEVYTKPLTTWRKNQLLRLTDDQTQWLPVGDNAEMVTWTAMDVPHFPYPLDMALERFHTSKGIGHTVLVHFGDTPVAADPASWFQHYNGRQTIEAGIKEGKQTFQMHHLKVRSLPALFLQEHFAAFAANFVRWAAFWLDQQNDTLPAGWQDPTALPVKDLVAVAAHTSAEVFWFEHGCLLRFTSHSVFAGYSFSINCQWAYQLVLPFAESYVFLPP